MVQMPLPGQSVVSLLLQPPSCSRQSYQEVDSSIPSLPLPPPADVEQSVDSTRLHLVVIVFVARELERRSQRGGGVRELERRSQRGGVIEEELERRSQRGGVREEELERRSQRGVVRELEMRSQRGGGVRELERSQRGGIREEGLESQR